MALGNLLIRASAGTGKTYALAMRFIELMKEGKVAPESVLAVTFSRAAAQEIYSKILNLLVKLAEKDPSYIPLVRKTIATQHRGTIATIDSFIMRIVKAFPSEMGIDSGVTDVLTDWKEQDAFDRAVDRVLARRDDELGFIGVFRSAVKGKWSVSCRERISSAMRGFKEWFLEHREIARQLTREELWRKFGVTEEPDEKPWDSPDWNSDDPLCAEIAKRGNAAQGAESISKTLAPVAAELLVGGSGNGLSYTYRNKTRNLSPREAGLARQGVQILYSRYMRRQIDAALAIVRLLEIFYCEYDRVTKRQGKLTFSDFTRLQSSNELGESQLKLADVEFRLDSRFDHWEMDEFQDTSDIQWQGLKRLVESAAGGDGGRSVMVVGDLKQSIYGWRGGSDKPFRELMESGFFTGEMGETKNSDVSHRYGGIIADFINKVFAPERIGIESWRREWRNHESVNEGGFVKIIEALAETGEKDHDTCLRTLVSEVAREWSAHEDANSSETIAILVRKNSEGEEIAKLLDKAGVTCTWEGKASIAEDWSVSAILYLLRLSEHPEDKACWNAVTVLSPLKKVLFPELDTAAEVAAAVGEKLLKEGLSRTVCDFAAKLEVDVKDLVRLARDYEQLADSEYSMDNFTRHVKDQSRRENALGPRVVHILTIHRSKGLTFDRVFCVLPDGFDFANAEYAGQDVLRTQDWVLPHVSKQVVAFNVVLGKALASQMSVDALANVNTNYVALTRARSAMFLVVPQGAAGGFAESYGDYQEYIRIPEGRLSSVVLAKEEATNPETIAPSPVSRRTPSTEIQHVSRGDMDLFAEDFGAATELGKIEHAKFAAIEWGEGVFAKPSDDAVVWREKPYELLKDGVWESGTFDRVVFSGVGEGRTAHIVDFKTNRLRSGETPDEFARRMIAVYSGQLAAYREALAALAGIPRSRIRTSLYLTAISGIFDC